VLADRAGLLRRAASALAGGLPRHPSWRFAFLSHATTDPLFVALQYGIQDGVALVGCTSSWGGSATGDPDEIAKAVDLAVDEKAAGIAVPLLASQALEDAIGRATVAGLPVVGLAARVPGALRLPFVGMRSQPTAQAIARRLRGRLPRAREVAVFAGDRQLDALRPLADGLVAALARRRGVQARLVPTGEDVYAQLDLVGEYVDRHAELGGLVALDTGSTEGVALALKNLGPRGRRMVAAGTGVLPATLELVADGRLAFTVDPEPYQQGFLAALQLFLAKLSGGLVAPSDVRTGPIFVTSADLRRYRDTRTRFEGSSSRQRYPVG
jgi:simple sugar transport system substrate-binding protein